jgi:hypothetical protein
MELHPRPRVLGAAVLGAGLLAAGLMAPTASAAPSTCQAKNLRTGTGYQSLARAISAAGAGDTIEVSGTCVGSFTTTRDIALQGKGKQATLDGNGKGTVLAVAGGTATLRELIVRGGSTKGAGGGILLQAGNAATLVDVDVKDNVAGQDSFGGGIEAGPGAELLLVGSTVERNTAGGSGGIDSDGATVSLHDSTVTNNHATHAPSATGDGCAFSGTIFACAGGIWNFLGTLTLVDSTVDSNSALHRGGGLRTDASVNSSGVATAGLTILGGSTTIDSNSVGDEGGGIWTRVRQSGVPFNPSVAFVTDGSVTDPITGAAVPAWTGSVTNNTPDQCAALGFTSFQLGTHTCGATFN